MKIHIPEHIDLNYPERYDLNIEISPENIAVAVIECDNQDHSFYQCLYPENYKTIPAFFQDILFENEFFLFNFRKVNIINYSQTFTFVPDILFNEKEKGEYMNFLFCKPEGKVLFQKDDLLHLILLHTIPDDLYQFIQRTFVGVEISHHLFPLLRFFNREEFRNKDKRMLVNIRKKGIDILCFDQEKFLLGNHFECTDLNEIVYYTLFIWKQLKFDQHKDRLYLSTQKEELNLQLKNYIENIHWIEYPESLGMA